MADRSRCPRCGERVSPYAAGCAVCGAELDTGRWDSGPGISTQLSSLLNAISLGGYGTWLLGLLVLALIAYLYLA